MRKRAFVIHLARAAGRVIHVQKLIENCPVETEVVDAVDGRKLSADEIAAVYRQDRFFPRYPFVLRPAEIGCFLSHRLCWQKIVDQDLSHGLVFEDDAGLDPNKARAAIDLAERHIGTAGYIQLPVRRTPVHAPVVAEAEGAMLLRPPVVPLRLSGQLISNWAARQLLDLTGVFDRPVDTFLQMHWITDIVPMVVVPSGLADYTPAAGGSTISSRKSIVDRVNREVRRMVYRRTIGRLSRRHCVDA